MLEDRARLIMASVEHELNMVVHDDVVHLENEVKKGLLIFLSSHSYLQSPFADHLIWLPIFTTYLEINYRVFV